MKSRKALSSIVGTVFAIIALSTTVGYITYSMNVLDKYNQSILVTNADALDRNKEQIQVNGVTIDNNKFNITASDTGNIPVHLTRFWVTNTTDVDKVFRYNIDYNLAPGQSQIKIGQSLPIYAKTNQAYDLKLITDRGNVKEFTVNSAGTAPLNIQMLALPPSVPSGFQTQLVMTVTNNGTSTLTNLVPVLTPNGSPTATCTPDPISSPAKYNTLTPGSTAIFSWAVSATGTQDGQTCKFGAQLQNGYNKNFGNATITVTMIKLSSTNYAANAGVITNDYTAFRWTEGTTWSTDWAFPGCHTVDFQVTIANNNQTAGGYKLWLSKNSQIFFYPTTLPPNGKVQPTTYFLVNSATPSPLGITAYTDNSIGIPNQGGIATIYFGAASAGSPTQSDASCGNNANGLQANTPYFGSIVLYGKFTKNSNDINGGNYAQTIPFLAIMSTS